MKTTILFSILFLSSVTFGQVYKDPAAAVEDRVNDILSQMTLNEKLDYIGGYNSFYIRGISRLGLPEIKMSDGPVGVRNYGNTTAYPAGICLAATWDTSLVKEEGIALGKDARARGVHILLAPGMNIYRAPMCGRNFEYFGEDPYLSGQIAASYINGVQSQKVVCTAKHYAGNNQEWDRNNVSSNIDERTLHEIYLPAFKASVQEGKVGAIMDSYNLVNGIHATQNNHLNNEVLKNQWGFDGFVMSDWVATYNGLAAANGGLDLEMPSAAFMTRSGLLTYINNGTLKESVINDKVRRILRIIFRFGFYDNVQTISSIALDNTQNANVALNVARCGIVLLQNNDSILPLVAEKLTNLAVIGPNADQYVAGGGSSYTSPFHSVTILKGIKNLAGSGITVKYVSGMPDAASVSANSVFYTSSGSSTKGLVGEYFNNQNLTNPATISRTDTVIDFHWSGLPNISGVTADHFSIRWTGVIRPDTTCDYEFVVAGDDGFRLSVNNQLIINNWVDEAVTTKKAIVRLTAGQEYPVKLEYYENAGLAEISMGYRINAGNYLDAVNAAKSADAAIVCVGFNSNTEGEGFDRTFALPAGQDSLINAVAKANPNTIVVINSGGNVAMAGWVNNVKGIVQAWYPGQEGGTAVAEILFGTVNPSGKLPASFEKKWEDNPTFNSYYSTNKTVNYSEGVFLGYRYYDSKAVAPMFPFGYGLSYTNFKYSNLSIVSDTSGGKQKYIVTADIKNTGSIDGAEVVQLYVKDMVSSVPRPDKELKAFSKVNLAPGQTKTVTMVLNMDAFAFYSTLQNSFVVEKGDFEVKVGASSAEINLTGNITISDDYFFTGVSEKKASFDEYNIYPVPASDVLNFSTTSPKSLTQVGIYDINGRKIDSFQLINNSATYNCSKLNNGIYFCRFISENKVFSKKIVIKR
jgi:beta-glucosidase